uniref:Uncharacterized protein n=1 Tax=Romanomermis culicivorax TaxID=13658 RepID=A0A915KQ08_ROMCU
MKKFEKNSGGELLQKVLDTSVNCSHGYRYPRIFKEFGQLNWKLDNIKKSQGRETWFSNRRKGQMRLISKGSEHLKPVKILVIKCTIFVSVPSKSIKSKMANKVFGTLTIRISEDAKKIKETDTLNT